MAAKGLRFAVRAWSAWSPERETPTAWRAWAGATEIASSDSETGPIAIPMMLRRRATPLGQKVIASALACGEAAKSGRYVYASRHGEFSRTLGILKSLTEGELPSPAEFSMAVHNGLAGLLSIQMNNTHGHTALAAGVDSFGFGLMEAAACLVENPREPVLLLFGDEPLSGEFAVFGEGDVALPIVVALALVTPDAEDDCILFDATPRSATSSPTTSTAIEFLRFLLCGTDSAVSDGMRMTWKWRRAS